MSPCTLEWDVNIHIADSWNVSANASCTARGHLGLYRQIVGTVFFVLVWPIVVFDIKRFPLGRPAAALLGGALMVIFYVVTQDAAYTIVGREDSLKTLFLLIGMMMLSHYFDREGVLQFAALRVLGRGGAPFRSVLWKVCLTTGCLAALITNDAACLVITPLLLTEHKRQERDQKELWPLCLAIATSANIGSAATFFGNPQNAFIASAAGVSLSQFLVSLSPAAVLGLLLNTALLYVYSFRLICTNGGCKHRREGKHVIDTSTTTTVTTLAANGGDNLHNGSVAGYTLEDEAGIAMSHFHEQEGSQQSHSENSLVAPEQTFDGTLSDTVFSSDSLESTQSMPLPSPELDQDVDAAATSVPTELQSCTFSTSESTLLLPQYREDSENAALGFKIVDTVEKSAKRKRVAFLIWLAVISLISLALLIIPPQMIPSTSTVIEFDLGLVPFGAAILTMLADCIVYRRNAYDVMQQIDWNVILMFIGLFVWLEGFKTTCFPDMAFDALQRYMNVQYIYGVLLFSAFILVASNILSNVPLTILVVHQLCSLYKGCGEGTPLVVPAMLLAWVTTVAGNFTLIGSIANLIVAEKAKKSDYRFRMTFFGYLKFGVLSTLLVIASGLPTVYYLGKVAEEYIH